MGQYYFPTNIDKMEYLYSHDFDNGLKLMEHSYIGNNFMNVVERLLFPEGLWHNCRLVWAGDYMDPGLFIPKNTLNKEKRAKSKISIQKWFNTLPKAGRYIVNHSKKICLDLKKEKGRNGKKEFIIHPLSILTCSDNGRNGRGGRGGGDYHGIYENLVGFGAGDIISMEHKPMYEISEPICFIEDL